jgi:hypothetical protein
MSIDDIEAEILKLSPRARARLARKLLETLETLSDEENDASGRRKPIGATPVGTRCQILLRLPPMPFGTLGPS